MPKRRKPNLREMLAAALYHAHDADGNRLLPDEVRATNDIATIIGAVEWDHLWNLVGLQDDDEEPDNSPANLGPKVKAEYGDTKHKEKTHGVKHGYAGSDRHKITKSKRLRRKREAAMAEAQAKLLDTAQPAVDDRKPRRRGWGSRPMPGAKASGWRKPMNKKAEKR